MMMKPVLALLRLVPQSMAEKMDAPFMAKDRLALGRTHPAIPLTLANLLRCSCMTCPSFPAIGGEAVYCSGGKSSAAIVEKGCNCVICPLYDRCGSFNVAYFCIHGRCGARDERSMAARLKDLAGTYLERFTGGGDRKAAKSEAAAPDSGPELPVTLRFDREKEVPTTTRTTILNASLGAGIPHTHICGGRARCSTCRVLITEGLEHCRPRNAEEERLARIKGFSPQVRLACQTTVTGDVRLRRLVLDDADIRVAIQEGRNDPGDVGREAEVTVLFCDIRSFTSFAERSLPYDVIHILNRYFETIGAIIDRHGGYIDKYMGDGIMVVFGLDRTLAGHSARLALAAAGEIVKSLPEFNRYLASHFVVNTASRIESFNKTAGTTILASEQTRQMAGDGFLWGRSIDAAVQGKEEALRLHELLTE